MDASAVQQQLSDADQVVTAQAHENAWSNETDRIGPLTWKIDSEYEPSILVKAQDTAQMAYIDSAFSINDRLNSPPPFSHLDSVCP